MDIREVKVDPEMPVLQRQDQLPEKPKKVERKKSFEILCDVM